MRTLTVRVLGEFQADELDLAALGSRKARQLLRLLALACGRHVSVDALADALWAGTPPSHPADQVAVLVSRVRRQIGVDRVVRDDEGYRLRYDWLDVDELESVVAETERRRAAGNRTGAAAAARIALSLIRGEPSLAGLDGEWVGAQIAAITRVIRRARRVAATALLEAGQPMAAVGLLGAAIESEPYDEQAVRQLMRAEAAAGRPGAALAAFAALRERLADDLGTEPAPETSALHTAILRGEFTAARPTVRVTPLVGRDTELARLDELADRVAAGGPAVVTVIGEAGMGKTTLLRAWQARRAAAGDIILEGACGPLERSVPLDALIVALAGHLRRLDAADVAIVLGSEAELLAPLLGFASESRGRTEPLLADRDIGPLVLFAALVAVLGRLAAQGRVVVVLDDAHLAGPALAEWLRFLLRRPWPVLVVAAARPDEGETLPATAALILGPLDVAATAQLVGPARAAELYARSLGHPLFLSELAAAPEAGELPISLVDAVSARCDELGPAGEMLKAAAVLGSRLDVDLLAAVLHRPAVSVLDDAELAARRGLLVEDSGLFMFRHELVRAALAAGTLVGRRTLLHREAGRGLAGRSDVDPIQVAEHARLGGDLELAARSLRAAALRAGERFDHATAEALLDRAIQLGPDPEQWLARARVRTRRGNYEAALRDVERAREAGAAALEVGAWAAYFGRRFDEAIRYAQDGEISAADESVRIRCQIIGGRTRHAEGDLAGAERLLVASLRDATGTDRVTASAWFGVLRAHQSRTAEAMTLLRPAATVHVGVEHTSATMHALLFIGHAHALAGQPSAALEAFARYSAEVERRHVPRFSGRSVNFSGWVLRNVGATGRGLDAHLEALAAAGPDGTLELRVAALEDLAEERIMAADADKAAGYLRDADLACSGDLVFGWRLAMRSRLLHARLSLLNDELDPALQMASALAADAAAAGIPRYAAPARLLAHHARHRLGLPVDRHEVERDLTETEAAVAIESWWWTGETAAELGVPAWLDRAAVSVQRLAACCGELADSLRREADRRLARWRISAR